MTDSDPVPKLPEKAQQFSTTDALFRHLEEYHGITERMASERLHKLKRECGYRPDSVLIFDHTGNIYDPSSREWIGSLTQGGKGKT
jgi:hypothetical protein